MCLCMCHSQLPPVGGSALTRPVPFDGAPPSRGAGPWRCAGMAAGGVGPPPRGPLAGSVAGFYRRYRSLLPARTRPPYQCVGVPGVLAVSFGFSIRRAPPLFVFSFGVCRRVCRHRGAVGGSVGGSVAPGELSAVRSCLPDRPRPRLALFRRAWCPGGTVTVFPTVPARPVRVFVRSGFGGLERPSRIPIAARSKFVRRPES